MGVHRRRSRPGPARGVERSSTWSSSSSTRPAWSGRPRSRGSSSPSRCAATAASSRTPRASASCSTTCPTSSAASTPRARRRATGGTPTPTTTSGRPSCSPATRSRAPSTPRSRPGAGHPTAASSSTSPRAAAPEEILKKLPSMHHQFKELADVDITKEPMEVGPTCHYVMGGVEVDPDTAAAAGVPGLFAAGEVSGGMHGSNRLGGNSLSDLLVFGARAGTGAAAYVHGARRPIGRTSTRRSSTPPRPLRSRRSRRRAARTRTPCTRRCSRR